MHLLALTGYLLMIASLEGFISAGGTLNLEMSDLFLNLSSKEASIL